MLSNLWRVRGAIPVPNDADDPGLLSRIAHILEQSGATIVEEGPDILRYRFGGPSSTWRILRWLTIPELNEIRRDGIRGLRVLRYELVVLDALLGSLVAGPALAYWLWGLLGTPAVPDPIGAYWIWLLPAAGILIDAGWRRRSAGPRIRAILRGGFEGACFPLR
jgi:hypothetical protein